MPPLTLGYLRSGLTLHLAEVQWCHDGRIDVCWLGCSPRFLSFAYDEKTARRVLGDARREEARAFKRWSSSGQKLYHGPEHTFRTPARAH